MKLDRARLTNEIDAVAKDWDISGGFIVIKEGEVLHDNLYGFADRERGIPTTRESRYIMNTESSFFIGLSIFILIDQGKMKLNDKLSRFIPEYKQADQMTIKHLLKSQSGLPDFFYSQIMIELNEDNNHKALTDFDRVRAESKIFYQNSSFERVFSLIGASELEYEPGTPDRPGSESNFVFLAEVIRRVSGMPVFEFQKEFIFDPLAMTGVEKGSESNTVSYSVFKEVELVRLPMDYDVAGLFTVTLEDMKKLLSAMGSAKLLSKKMWDTVLKLDSEGNGILFENANGFDCGNAQFLGYGFYIYFNHKSGISFASLVNEEQKFIIKENVWHFFRKDSREVIESTFTYPVATKMVKLSKDNFWAALNIKVDPEQLSYVLEAKSSIAMALMFGTKKAFVEMEGNRVIGLLVLDIDPKKDYYHIDIIQIDRRFQNRGYGKIMLNWAVEYLAKEGAKELKIGVNRFNYGAQKIYMDAGFTAKTIYEEGMELHMTL